MRYLIIILAYLIGSIPFSLLLVRWTRGIDLRRFGSGNIGATNARRAAGTTWGVVALIGDALKGCLPAWAAVAVASHYPSVFPHWYVGIVGLAAIMGHMFPIYFKFKPSGKGVATTIGCFAVLSPPAAAVMVFVLVGTVVIWRRMSLGSIAGIVILPPAVWWFSHDNTLLICSLLVMVLVLIRHKDNILRLVRGTEPQMGRRNGRN